MVLVLFLDLEGQALAFGIFFRKHDEEAAEWWRVWGQRLSIFVDFSFVFIFFRRFIFFSLIIFIPLFFFCSFYWILRFLNKFLRFLDSGLLFIHNLLFLHYLFLFCHHRVRLFFLVSVFAAGHIFLHVFYFQFLLINLLLLLDNILPEILDFALNIR